MPASRDQTGNALFTDCSGLGGLVLRIHVETCTIPPVTTMEGGGTYRYGTYGFVHQDPVLAEGR